MTAGHALQGTVIYRNTAGEIKSVEANSQSPNQDTEQAEDSAGSSHES